MTDDMDITTAIYYAPTEREYRTLATYQIGADEADIGPVGSWAYAWRGRTDVGGFASEGAARQAGEAEGAQRWPGLARATGNEPPGVVVPGRLIAAEREGY